MLYAQSLLSLLESQSHHKVKCLFPNPIREGQTEVARELCRDAGCVWERRVGVKVGHGRSRQSSPSKAERR